MGSTLTPGEALDVLEGGTSGVSSNATIEDTNLVTLGQAGHIPAGLEPVGHGLFEPAGSLDLTDLPTDPTSLIDALRAAGLSDEQIAAYFQNNGGGGTGGSSGGGAAYDPMRGALEETYFRLWGKRAPEAAISSALSAGLNVFQFEDQIRQDPAFRRSETYQNEMADNVLELARMLGILPG